MSARASLTRAIENSGVLPSNGNDQQDWLVARDLADAILKSLVVLDPGDREQVSRLADAFCLARWEHVAGSDECDPLTRSSMEIALRSLIEPPKPAEPTGLGAVVEDVNGDKWVRTHATGYPWHASLDPSDRNVTAARKYDGITAVRVLSEGVQS